MKDLQTRTSKYIKLTHQTLLRNGIKRIVVKPLELHARLRQRLKVSTLSPKHLRSRAKTVVICCKSPFKVWEIILMQLILRDRDRVEVL